MTAPKEAARVLMGVDSFIASRDNSGSAFRLFAYTCVKHECLFSISLTSGPMWKSRHFPLSFPSQTSPWLPLL